MDGPHGIRLAENGIWIRHRRREFGPFDYEWSKDLHGVELTYAGRKFGEYCSAVEYFADLQEFQLPMTVVRVAIIAMTAVIDGLRHGLTRAERDTLIFDRLHEFGLQRFERLC